MHSVMVVVVLWLLGQHSVDPGVTLNTCCSSVLSCRYIYNIYHSGQLNNYHWRQLPQVSILLWHIFCNNKSMLAVSKNIIMSGQIFVVTNTAWQTHVCHGKTRLLLRPKVCLLRQTCVCHDNTCLSRQYVFVTTITANICRDTVMFFVAASMLLLQQKMCFCHDKHLLVTARQKWYLWQLPPVIGNSMVIPMVTNENEFETRVVVMWVFFPATPPRCWAGAAANTCLTQWQWRLNNSWPR